MCRNSEAGSTDLVVPQPTRVYLQKTIMNQIISDYFDSQKKRIPFQKATIAEAAVKQYRRKITVHYGLDTKESSRLIVVRWVFRTYTRQKESGGRSKGMAARW